MVDSACSGPFPVAVGVHFRELASGLRGFQRLLLAAEQRWRQMREAVIARWGEFQAGARMGRRGRGGLRIFYILQIVGPACLRVIVSYPVHVLLENLD